MDRLAELGYIGMFISAFLSGSIIPANSEIVMSALLALDFNKWIILACAVIGNLIGGMSCYYLGYIGKIDVVKKYMRIKDDKIERVKRFLDGKGAWLAFFVFVPFVGDISIVVFGLMHSNFLIVSIAMLLGKLLKYFIWMYVTIGVISLF
ncbi:MAG: VTT domain-containing protein [Bacteroidales bacterium]|nr:VTT domain-containing protein [Bacteroidales bacterium]